LSATVSPCLGMPQLRRAAKARIGRLFALDQVIGTWFSGNSIH
jgi:hypothetical protein